MQKLISFVFLGLFLVACGSGGTNNPDPPLSYKSISTRTGLTDNFKIANGSLEIVAEANSEIIGTNIWLLAKEPNTIITSMSADVRHKVSNVSLVLELSNQGNIDYFHIGAQAFGCPTDNCYYPDRSREVSLQVFTIGSESVFEYLGRIVAISSKTLEYLDRIVVVGSKTYTYTKQASKTLYVGEDIYVASTSRIDDNDYQFGIELDKNNKRVVVRKGNQSGYFDISDSYFGDLSTAVAKFFIKYYVIEERGRMIAISREGIRLPPASSFVDNIQINHQPFDDFSTSELDTTKWDVGQFLSNRMPNFNFKRRQQ